jgi:Tol biopolymer transport system component
MFLIGLGCLAGAVLAGSTRRVSVDTAGGEADGPSDTPAVSADGRIVAFTSDATDLVSGDTNGRLDVFVHDRSTRTTTRVSVSSSGAQANHGSKNPALSASGRYVVFESLASNLVSGDTNGAWDVFRHDRQTGTTTRVSVSSAGAQGNGPSIGAAITGYGDIVAFSSTATNLVSGDTNGDSDVFVHDVSSGTTTRVSTTASGGQADGPSGYPSVSADNDLVAFHSDATNLVGGDTNATSDVFVKDRGSGGVTRVSVSSAGTQGNGFSGWSDLSADGRYVVFDSQATNLVSGDINGRTDVFLHDRDTGTTTRLSVSTAGVQGDGTSSSPSIDRNGQYVAFWSRATNLVAGDTNGAADIFLRDLRKSTTSRVSLDSAGLEADGDSFRPRLSEGGCVAVFQSDATDLVSGDTNAVTDVFVRAVRVCVNASVLGDRNAAFGGLVELDPHYGIFNEIAPGGPAGYFNAVVMAADNDRLAVAWSQVGQFLLVTPEGDLTSIAPVPDSPNGIALDQDGTYVVSTSGGNALYRVDVPARSSVPFLTAPATLNAVCLDEDTGDYVLAIHAPLPGGALLRAHRRTGQLTTLAAGLGRLTGVDFVPGTGAFVVTRQDAPSLLRVNRTGGVFPLHPAFPIDGNAVKVDDETGRITALGTGEVGFLDPLGQLLAAFPTAPYLGTAVETCGSRKVNGSGPATGGSTMSIAFSFPESPGATYVAALSTGLRPGIPLADGTNRVIQLDVTSPLFPISIGGLPGLTTGFTGILDPLGRATGTLAILPGTPPGLRLFVTAIAVNAGKPSGLDTANTWGFTTN